MAVIPLVVWLVWSFLVLRVFSFQQEELARMRIWKHRITVRKFELLSFASEGKSRLNALVTEGYLPQHMAALCWWEKGYLSSFSQQNDEPPAHTFRCKLPQLNKHMKDPSMIEQVTFFIFHNPINRQWALSEGPAPEPQAPCLGSYIPLV